MDVADLESEAEHHYELLGARDGDEVAGYGPAPDGHPLVDGGRTMRTHERFVAHLRAGERTRAVVRLEAQVPTRVHVRAGGREVAFFEVEPAAWTEAIFNVPAESADPETSIEVAAGGARSRSSTTGSGRRPDRLRGKLAARERARPDRRPLVVPQVRVRVFPAPAFALAPFDRERTFVFPPSSVS